MLFIFLAVGICLALLAIIIDGKFSHRSSKISAFADYLFGASLAIIGLSLLAICLQF